MRYFYNSEASIESTGEVGETYVSHNGKRVDYMQIEDWLFDKMLEEGHSLNPVTLQSYTIAHNHEILEYIKENGK